MSIDDELLIEIERLRNENAQLKLKEKLDQKRAGKNWSATIYLANGSIAYNNKGEALVRSFMKASEAERWIDLHLMEQEAEAWAKIKHTHSKMCEIIERWQSLARLLKHKGGAVCQSAPKSSKRELGFEWKMKESRSSFSEG